MEEKDIIINGKRVHFLETGQKSKPAIILIHGWPMSSTVWREMVPFLENKYHLFALDLPGFGHSEPLEKSINYQNLVSFINKFIIRQHLRRVTLLGCSFGGVISIYYQNRFPNKVKSLILIVLPLHYSHFVNRIKRLVALKLIKGFALVGKLYDILNKSRFTRQVYFKHNPYIGKYITPDRAKEVYAEYCLYDGTTARKMLWLILSLNLYPKLSKISCPVLLINGQQDKIIPPNIAKRACRAIAKSQVVIIDQADHALISEHPQKIASCIKKFLNSL